VSCEFKVGDRVRALDGNEGVVHRVAALFSPEWVNVELTKTLTAGAVGDRWVYPPSSLTLLPPVPKVGDRVRIPAREGVVTYIATDGCYVTHDDKSSNSYQAHVPIEILPPPEPEYVIGDWYRTIGNHVYRRIQGGWMSPYGGVMQLDEPIRRSLVHLVPERPS